MTFQPPTSVASENSVTPTLADHVRWWATVSICVFIGCSLRALFPDRAQSRLSSGSDGPSEIRASASGQCSRKATPALAPRISAVFANTSATAVRPAITVHRQQVGFGRIPASRIDQMVNVTTACSQRRLLIVDVASALSRMRTRAIQPVGSRGSSISTSQPRGVRRAPGIDITAGVEKEWPLAMQQIGCPIHCPSFADAAEIKTHAHWPSHRHAKTIQSNILKLDHRP